MSYFQETSKILKHCLKKKVGISASLIVTFLIAGTLSSSVLAQDTRGRESNSIHAAKDKGPTLIKSENGTDVINIQNPNSSGLSHNKYEDFNVGNNNNVIFNNSQTDGASVTGGNVKANANLKAQADIILNEIIGQKPSYLNGGLEVFGKKADLIMANENGIMVNGANFINTTAVTLATGKVNVNDNKVVFDTNNKSSLDINEKGLSADADYINFIANTMKLNGKINSEEKKNSNINVVLGDNKVSMSKEDINIETTKAEKAEGIALSAANVGAMYGNNINIISTKAGFGVNYDGLISSKEDVKVTSEGNISVKDTAGKNISMTAKDELKNKGTMKAEKNVSLNAKKVLNESQLEGEVKVVAKENGTKYIDRNRKIVYVDYHLTLNNLVEVENNLKLKKASIEAGNDIEINNNTENTKFENLSGDLKAGNDIKIKGDFASKDLTKELSIEDILKEIKVDLRWEHRSLVDNAYFNGGDKLQQASLLEALEIMTDKKDTGFYTALKQENDPTLNKLLSAYLGSDWRVRDEIKPKEEWNKEAVFVAVAPEKSEISAKNIYVEGKDVSLGENKAKSTEISLKDQKFTTVEAQANVNANNTIKADNIVIKADNIANHNTDMTASENISLTAKEKLSLSNKNEAKNILVEANDVEMTSVVSYDKEGKQVLAKKATLLGKEKVGLKAKNINLKAADIKTENAGKLAIASDNLNVEDIKVINANYKAKLEEGGREKGRILKTHEYTKDTNAEIKSVASNLSANTVGIEFTDKVNITGSVVTGTNDDSNILINGKGTVDIKNANDMTYTSSYSDARGKNKKGKYKIVNVNSEKKEALDIIASELKSEGNLVISSKNLNVKSSSLEAKKDIKLNASENISILADLIKTKEEISKVDWGSGTINGYKFDGEIGKVVSTTIKSGSKVEIEAKNTLTNSSSEIEGNTVDVKAKNTVNDAVANTTKTKEKKVAVGVNAGGSVGFSGAGASIDVNTITGEVKKKVVGKDGIIAKDNEFKDAAVKGKVGAEIDIKAEEKDVKEYKNSTIKVKENVNIKAEEKVDLSNTDITAEKDVNVSAKKVVAESKTNSEKVVNNNANISISGEVVARNSTVSKVNGYVNEGGKLKALVEEKKYEELVKKLIDLGKDVKAFVENLPKAVKEDILAINAKQSLNIVYDNKTKTTETAGKTNIAGNNVNITATEENIDVTNTHIKAKETANLKAKEEINLNAGTNKVHDENNGFTAGVGVTENVGVNVVDGANAKVGIAVNGSYRGNTDLTKESANSSIEAGKVNKDAKVVNEADKTTMHYKDKRGAGIDANLKVGVSTNHVIAVDGKVSGNVKYIVDAGNTKEKLNGEKESFNIKTGINASGSIDTNGQNPNFKIGTEATEIEKDGKTLIKLNPYGELITKEKVDKIKEKIKEKKNGGKPEEKSEEKPENKPEVKPEGK